MISIIIPVYNVAQYIDQCLQSVIDQSYTDWECILVDDGSKDGSGAKCDEWCHRDSRFRVIHQPNQGVSAARNNGINATKGEYIVFIDSDDWVDADYLKDMYEANGASADLVVSGIKNIKNGVLEDTIVPLDDTIFSIDSSGSDFFLELLEKYLLYGPCTKLYVSNLIKRNKIHFDSACSYGEDLLFNFEYLKHTAKIQTVAKCNYYYRQDETNSLSKKYREDQFDNDYRLWTVRKDFLTSRGIWNEKARIIMYRLLWGQVYNGIFTRALSVPITYSYTKHVLSIPEIHCLQAYSNLFDASNWIKYLIAKRQAFLIFIYLRFICR